MTIVDVLSHPFWRAWAETLLHFLWQGAVLGLVAALLLRRRSLGTASQRYAVSLAALLLMAACVPITFAIVAPSVAARNVLTPSILSAAALPAAEVPAKARDAFLISDIAAQPEALFRWVVVVWSIGVVALSLRIFASWIGMRLLARGRRPVPTEIGSTIASLSMRLGLRRVPVVFASARVVDATVVGFLKPMVLLPAAWLVELSPDMLEAVLAHELAHIRRHDLWINLVQRVVETVLFYHPAVWWVSRRLRSEREMCCDELAVSVTHQRLVYVTTLESVARRRAGLVKPALAVTLGDQDMALLKRIRHILGFSAGSSNTGWWPAGIVALALPAALWFGWTSFVPGGTAIADEAATVVDIFKSGMSDYDSDLVIGKIWELQRHRGTFADATNNSDDATPAKSEAEKKEDRSAPPGLPPEGRPDGDRGGLPGGYGRGDRGPERGRRRPLDGRRPGRPDDDDRRPDDDDRRPEGASDDDHPGRPEPGPRGRLGGMAGRRGPQPGDDDDDDRPAHPGMRPGIGMMPGRRGAGMGGLANPPRGREVDEDESDAQLHQQRHQAGPQDEMVRLLRDLHREVEQLRREVRELRDERRPRRMGDEPDAVRRVPPSNDGRDDELRGWDGVDEEGNPVRLYREDRDGNLRRAFDRGTRITPPFRKDRLSGERPRGAAPMAPGARRPDGPDRRERPDDSSREPGAKDGPPEPPRRPKPAPPDDGSDAKPANDESRDSG